MSPLGPTSEVSILSLLFCIIIMAACEDEDLPPCMRVEVCEGGKLVDVIGFIRHEVLAD